MVFSKPLPPLIMMPHPNLLSSLLMENEFYLTVCGWGVRGTVNITVKWSGSPGDWNSPHRIAQMGVQTVRQQIGFTAHTISAMSKGIRSWDRVQRTIQKNNLLSSWGFMSLHCSLACMDFTAPWEQLQGNTEFKTCYKGLSDGSLP